MHNLPLRLVILARKKLFKSMKRTRAASSFEILLSEVRVAQLHAAFHQNCSAPGGINRRKANRESIKRPVSLENKSFVLIKKTALLN